MKNKIWFCMKFLLIYLMQMFYIVFAYSIWINLGWAVFYSAVLGISLYALQKGKNIRKISIFVDLVVLFLGIAFSSLFITSDAGALIVLLEWDFPFIVLVALLLMSDIIKLKQNGDKQAARVLPFVIEIFVPLFVVHFLGITNYWFGEIHYAMVRCVILSCVTIALDALFIVFDIMRIRQAKTETK